VLLLLLLLSGHPNASYFPTLQVGEERAACPCHCGFWWAAWKRGSEQRHLDAVLGVFQSWAAARVCVAGKIVGDWTRDVERT